MVDFITRNRIIILLSLLITVVAIGIIFVFSLQQREVVDSLTPTPTQIPARTPPDPVIPAHEIPEGAEIKPWMFSLPLQNPNYYVEYDAFSDTIQANVSTFYSRSIPREDQAEFLKTRIQERLKELGVDVSQETIVWAIENN